MKFAINPNEEFGRQAEKRKTRTMTKGISAAEFKVGTKKLAGWSKKDVIYENRSDSKICFPLKWVDGTK